jgi:hypothetical protein
MVYRPEVDCFCKSENGASVKYILRKSCFVNSCFTEVSFSKLHLYGTFKYLQLKGLRGY